MGNKTWEYVGIWAKLRGVRSLLSSIFSLLSVFLSHFLLHFFSTTLIFCCLVLYGLGFLSSSFSSFFPSRFLFSLHSCYCLLMLFQSSDHAWRPTWLRRRVFISFAVWLSVLCAMIEALLATFDRDTGIATPSKGSNLHYLWAFGPVAGWSLSQPRSP